MQDKILFQSHLNKARQDKFSLILNIPNVLRVLNNKFVKNNQYFDFDTLQFSIWNINIPSVQVPENSFQVFGQPYYLSTLTRPVYQPCLVNFAVDNEFKNYWVLWKWLNLYNQNLEGYYANDPKIDKHLNENSSLRNNILDYRTDIIVIGKDEFENEKIKFKFVHSFISELGDISYNYRNKEELDCSFKFVFNQMDIELLDITK